MGGFMRAVRNVAIIAALAVIGWSFAAIDNPLLASAMAAPARSDVVNFQSFHDRLAPYGTWMNHHKWGAVWRPNAGRGFRPYRDRGHWENTDEYGTVWVSDYGWGDIPFHYGRWVYDLEDGWIWVPGYVWAPAWVIWRAGDGDIGWLPMPPWLDYDGTGDFPDDWSDAYGFGGFGYPEDEFDSFWCFVDAGDLFAPSIDYYVIGPRYTRGILGRTKGWTRFSIYHGHLFNRSIDRDRFRATFGHDLREGKRHDFEGRLGPIVDVASGRNIAAHERTVVHTMPAVKTTPRYEIREETTRPTYSAHTVHVYRGGPATVSTIHHTTTHVYQASPYVRSAPTVHPMLYHVAPAPHPVTSSHPASGSPPHGPPPHPHG
jgi:hypothetical protein